MALDTVPEGLAEALSVVDGLDATLGRGLSRVDDQAGPALDALAATLNGSPLGAAVAEAVANLRAGELHAHHLVTLAAAREGLLGAVHDALLDQAAEASGLRITTPELLPTAPRDPSLAPRLDSVRQWLLELALAGFTQLDRATLAPMVAGLAALQGEPSLRRPAALLTGLVYELLAHAPTSQLTHPPLRRWADLWSRALLGTVVGHEVPTSTRTCGSLSVLGAELRHHAHLVEAVIHGMWQDEDGVRLVRCPVSIWKVDAVGPEEVWALLRAAAPELIDALAAPATLALEGVELLTTGELRWSGDVTSITAFDPFAADLSTASLTAPAPRDRHPIQLAIPVVGPVLNGALGGTPLSADRVSPLLELDDLSKATEAVGLLRWDEGWTVQPLVIRTKKKLLGPERLITLARKSDATAAAVLRERASKLLRAS